MKTRAFKTALVLIAVVVFWAIIPASARLEGYEDGGSGESAAIPVLPANTAVGYYVVKEGDNLWSIAGRNGITVEALAAANNLVDRDFVQVGQMLKLPVDCTVHVVQSGETLESIAAIYRVSVAAVANRNDLHDVDKILAGQRLIIPVAATVPAGSSGDNCELQMLWPVLGPITSLYGMRSGQPHEGIDIAADEGSQIRAAGPGRVVFAGSRGTYGLAVIVDHGGGVSTLYAHCSRTIAAEGKWVEAGTVIAEVGNTGRSRGPHLHLEVRRDGVPCDPLVYLAGKIQ